MKDKRNEALAHQLLDYSTELQKGEVLYLEIKGKATLELGKQIIRLAAEKGATPKRYIIIDASKHVRRNATGGEGYD